MRTGHCRATTIAATAVVAGLALSGCGSSSSGVPVYGPAGSEFTMAFPSTPKTQANTPALLQSFPKGTDVHALWVSPDSQVFGSAAPIPHPPTYVMIVADFSSVAAGSTYVAQVAQVPGMKAITEGGVTGYAFVGLEDSAINQGTTLTDPKAVEGLLVLHRGSTVYLAFAVTAESKQAESFLTSFRFV